MENKRLQEQLSFILELDKEKNILRQTHLSNHGRREDDAEHAWHMAVMAYLLQEYSNETVDIGHVMIMCLLHDVVEIDAGDTYAYDDQGKKTQHEREEKAAERIYGILPEDQKIQLRALFEEFEENRTPEAKFAHAMDNLQPLLLNDSNGGGDWKEHHVSYNTVMQRQGKTKEGSTALFEVIKEKMDKHADAGNLIDDREKEDQ
ncbi:MAG: HD domain-containing protein [Erysipelotrichaceae bacterium]|jgi:putative hydrolase of HD superfamily|nr:HD domain-containing protein [Erysipelotrichaceae bacterium]MCI1325814.1 HD domain-containing protein [Solobacterium sp.]MCH4044913.1 HD domain-containing protein [Erysipelotrichaceae bacterium]MCH4122125.1 HD domain-containing protein [Erysipelotrichaceae bacterium]MCI1362613.1 HD domain-containing protein [Solobacterium sp.]